MPVAKTKKQRKIREEERLKEDNKNTWLVILYSGLAVGFILALVFLITLFYFCFYVYKGRSIAYTNCDAKGRRSAGKTLDQTPRGS